MTVVRNWLIPLFVTVGVGKIPWAPGTWGSLIGLIIWWILDLQSLPIACAVIGVTFLLSWPAVSLYEKQGRSHDPKEVVIDEVLGIWITLIALPLTPGVLAMGFILFRIFDILKPPPIRTIDREMPGALGTICDDLLAGLIARIILGYLVSLEWTWMM